eukprot:14590204-Ditylum_brightwellii.AAC.1
MTNVMVAFKFNDDDRVPVGHKKIDLYMVFNIKMDTLQRKARLATNGTRTDPPKDITFSSIVSRDSIQLFFMLASLNDINILTTDIQNAYLSAEVHPSERDYTEAGLEFEPDQKGRPA